MLFFDILITISSFVLAGQWLFGPEPNEFWKGKFAHWSTFKSDAHKYYLVLLVSSALYFGLYGIPRIIYRLLEMGELI